LDWLLSSTERNALSLFARCIWEWVELFHLVGES